MTGGFSELVAAALRLAPYCKVPGCHGSAVALDLSNLAALATATPDSAFALIETRCAIHAGDDADDPLGELVTL